MAKSRQTLLILAAAATLWTYATAQSARFYPDDPIQAVPPPLSINKPRTQHVDESLDFIVHSTRTVERPAKKAGAINTLGEVPDSEWFTNRHAQHRMTRGELQHGPPAQPPIPPFEVTGGKNEGISPGFEMRDSRGRRYFVKTDPLANPELATSADVIVSRFLYAIGYNTPRNDVVRLKQSDLHLAAGAKLRIAGQGSRKMLWRDVEDIVKQIPHYTDGSFRIVASLAIDGETIGPFRYEGTRLDDPNDVVPHEDRRDLRGLYAISAWLNNTDTKASNTLDTVIEQNGIRFVRHYLIDFGSALGSDGNDVKDARFGHEYMIPTADVALKKIVTIGLSPEPWEHAHFPHLPGVGNFEAKLFDADCWKSDYPNPAFLSRLPDDDYWAAKQIMAFTDDDIRAVVETAGLTEPRSTEYMIATLAERRNKIGRAFFSKLLPLDHFHVKNGQLLFEDLAAKYGFHEARSYEVRWSNFDNATGKGDPIPDSKLDQLPSEITTAPAGSYFHASIRLPGEARKSVSIYLRKEGDSYKVVGIDRAW